MRPHLTLRTLVAAAIVACVASSASGFIIRPNDPDPWLSTASGPRSGNGAPATLTWSFVPDGTAVTRSTGVGTSSSNLIAFMNSNFGGSASQTDLTQQPWFHLFEESFDRWEQLSGVNYVYEPDDSNTLHPGLNGSLGVRGDIRLGGITMDGSGGTLAFTYLPIDGGDVAIDTGEASFFNNSTNNFRNFRNTLMHEIGHSFGLDHVNSTTSNLLMEPVIDTSFDGPQLDEIRGVQFYFGDANEKANGGQGNASTALATSLGTIGGGMTKKIGASANVAGQAISPAATDFVSIANSDDEDFYSFTVSQRSAVTATLTPRGGVFTQGGTGEAPTSFDANARNNLSLTLFATNGTTTLATANAQPSGQIESVSNLVLPAGGTYFAEIDGADDTVQLYELSLAVVALSSGDYNSDGVVNAADYTSWRNSLGQLVSAGTGADGSGPGGIPDGIVDSFDYDLWKSHYGETASSGAIASAGGQVPEPAGWFLLYTLTMTWLVRRRCRTLPSPRIMAT